MRRDDMRMGSTCDEGRIVLEASILNDPREDFNVMIHCQTCRVVVLKEGGRERCCCCRGCCVNELLLRTHPI